MTDFSLKQIVLLNQELVALSRVIEMSFEAFRIIDYPEYYEFSDRSIWVDGSYTSISLGR